MRYAYLAAVIAFAVSVGVAVAGDMPARKPGLWELSLSTAGRERPPTVARYCIDASTAALLDNYAAGATGKHCRKNESHREGTNYVVDSECTISNSKVSGRAVITVPDSDHVHVSVHSHFEPALHGSTDADTIQDSRWLGACPSDMHPGDVLTATGQKLNLKSILGASP